MESQSALTSTDPNMSALTPSNVHDKHISAWDYALNQLLSNNGEIHLPGNVIEVIGYEGLNALKDRFEAKIQKKCQIEHISGVDVFRIAAVQVLQPSEPLTETGISQRPSKQPPRPMNRFLLYRAFRHPFFKAQGMTNAEISKAISDEWKAGGQPLHDEWEMKAQEAKADHKARYPGYKYSPRRPGEKKKRRSRKATLIANQANSTLSVNNNPIGATFPIGENALIANLDQNTVSNLETTMPIFDFDPVMHSVAGYSIDPSLDHDIFAAGLENAFAREERALRTHLESTFNVFRSGMDGQMTLPPFETSEE